MQHNIIRSEPLIVNLNELLVVYSNLILGERKWINLLHDVWKMGAPLPSTNPHIAEGNIKRVMSPFRLAYWLKDITAARGMPLTIKQALNILEGIPDYGLDE